ncbi:MAG: DUF5596 domain-containing protein [Oscillospiraceae bacterium]|nr:DUF5596 domain-containing protein [Oscillospiraceae bacterium]
MENAARAFCQRLGIKFSDAVVPFYKEGLSLFEKSGSAIAEKERIEELDRKYCFLRKWKQDIYHAADIIKKDADLLLYNYTLYCIIRDHADVSILPPPDRGVPETDFSPMFALLWFLEDMISDMERRGLPHSVISDTLYGFDAEINDYYDMFSRSGMRRYVEWFLLFVYNKIIRVGRLNFEFKTLSDRVRVYKKGDDIKILIDGAKMHTGGMMFGSAGQDDEKGSFFAEIEEFPDGSVSGFSVNGRGECVPEKITLSGYREVLRPGDEVCGIHIPANEPFSADMCRAAISDFKTILQKHYPERKIKAFICDSWMLEPALFDIMGKETNITRFAKLFLLHPRKSDAEDVYFFLFHVPEKVPAETLPEKSSMQRAVKEYLMQGNPFYEKAGIILYEE